MITCFPCAKFHGLSHPSSISVKEDEVVEDDKVRKFFSRPFNFWLKRPLLKKP